MPGHFPIEENFSDTTLQVRYFVCVCVYISVCLCLFLCACLFECLFLCL